MARPTSYTADTLRRAVNKYFKTITRTVTVTEKKDSGQRDNKGHVIWNDVPVTNNLGKPLEITEYLVPPTVGGLCEFLGIHRDTWNAYCKQEEFSDTTTHAQGRMRAWREEQLVTRKDVKGIVFDLENNYGYREHRDVRVTGSVEDFLKAQGEEAQEF